MEKIDLIGFRGEIPITDSRNLPASAAEFAQNCEFKHGALDALMGLEQVAGIVLANDPVTSIYLYENAHWFSWDEHVTAIRNAQARDDYKRVYFCDSNGARVTSNLIATGSDPKPAASYTLGVQQPDPVMIVQVNEDPGNDPEETSDDETRYYTITYVTEYGEEGMPAEASAAAELKGVNDTVDLTLPVPASNTENILTKKIYRTAPGDDENFFFVDEIPVAQTAYTDSVSSVGTTLDTYDYSPPPDGSRNIAQLANGITALTAGNQVLFSPAYLPYAYPYSRSTEHDIVAAKATRTSYVVGTKGNPYVFSGVSPDAMSEEKLSLNEACVSERGMVDLGDIVMYPSPNGLVAVSDSSAELITRKIISKDEWEYFQPETIHAYHHEGKYIGFYGEVAGFIFDPADGTFTRLNFYATAGFDDLLTDTLYLVIDSQLFSYNKSGSLEYVWRSKIYEGPKIKFGCMRIDSDNLSRVRCKIWADGRLIFNQKGLPDTDIKFGGVLARRWQVELISDTRIYRVQLAQSASQL